jgi:hypothetical protein
MEALHRLFVYKKTAVVGARWWAESKKSEINFLLFMAASHISCFSTALVIQKGLQRIIGNLKYVKKLKSGALLTKVANK